MKFKNQFLLFSFSVGMVFASLMTPISYAGGWKWPTTTKITTVQALARKIDRLEKHIDEYGSVVPKSPDVWGEARLTKYRRMVEKQLKTLEDKFSSRINGAISRSDQAYLTSSLALQAAITGRAPSGAPTEEKVTSVDRTYTEGKITNETTTERTLGDSNSSSSDSAPTSSSESATSSNQDQIKTPSFESESFRLHKVSFAADGENNATIQLEPTVELDQHFRYLKHLNALRRINEGDDTSDAPGYALHLVRIPVSVLPGKKTRQGYGAEVTITAKPHLHEKLLPVTFQELVINDLIDQFAFPLAKILDSKDGQELIEKILKYQSNKKELIKIQNSINDLKAEIKTSGWNPSILTKTEKQKKLEAKIELQFNRLIQKKSFKELYSFSKSSNMLDESADVSKNIDTFDEDTKSLLAKLDELKNEDAKLISEISKLSTNAVPVATFRRSQLPFPPSQAYDIYGKDKLEPLLLFANRIKSDPRNKEQVLLLDLQKLLKEELQSAYNLLESDFEYWSLCTQKLAHAIRHHDLNTITTTRIQFYNRLEQTGHYTSKSHVAILAWSVLVESALLNERLIEDMRELSAAKNAFHLNTEWMPFYLPEPPMEAIAVFNDYVTCRWPIHVFAIDPVSEDQNIADSFTQRREMQLAMSMALVAGEVSANQFTRFARRTELSMDAIGINRTVVGFSHGDDTFGWRFYPRFQTPPSPGTATVFFRDLLMGGPKRDHLLNKRMLEPGTRECTALVIMPSFVPYAIFDTRTNWFKLTNPSKKEFNLSDTVSLSKDITGMRALSKACKQDAHLYRKDEVYRLNRAVEQLDRRLPLQTKYVQVPHENSHGGFEFFNNGVTDLAPELKGFYGEPGVLADSNKVEVINLATTSINADGTAATSDNNISTGREIFLVGDNFSVHETNVIAGNQSVNFELLSRQIMRVTIPATVRSIPLNGDKKTRIVDVHVATPYGISNHLSIPVIESITEKNDAEMKKVAETVVNTAIQNQLGSTYDWKKVPKNVQIALKYEGQNLKCFDIPENAGTLEVVRKTSSKEINNLFKKFELKHPEIAFWVTVSSGVDGVDPIRFPMKTCNAASLTKETKDTNELTRLIQEIEFQITHQTSEIRIPLSHQAKKITLEGYIRHNFDGNPVNKLASSIEIAVKIKEVEECAKDSKCSSTKNDNTFFESPFDKIPFVEKSNPRFVNSEKENSGFVRLKLNDSNQRIRKQVKMNPAPKLLLK